MSWSAKPGDGPIADAPAHISISGREILAKGVRPYERYRFVRAGEDGAPRALDILHAGPAAAVVRTGSVSRR